MPNGCVRWTGAGATAFSCVGIRAGRMEPLGCGASKELARAGAAQVASNINAYFLFERWDGESGCRTERSSGGCLLLAMGAATL